MDEDEDQRVVELFRYRMNQVDTSRPPASSDTVDHKQQPASSSWHDADSSGENLTSRTSKPDTTLLALCQLAATRIDAKLVGISLLGRHDQYVLAEATQFLELDGASAHSQSEDAQWLGLCQGDWHYNLCQKAIQTQAQDGASVPLYCISDAAADTDLGVLACVKAEPYVKSFWGSPIQTTKHYRIGVLWMLDDKVRPGPMKDQLRFIGQVVFQFYFLIDTDIRTRTIASLVMQNLESRKESIERRRILRMSKAVDRFIDGDQADHYLRNRSSSATDASHEGSYSDHPTGLNQTRDDSPPGWPDVVSPTTPGMTEKAQNALITKGENTVISNAESSTDDEAIDSKDKRDRDRVYARASYLIREGLAMQGCVFFDTSTGFLVREHDSEGPGKGPKRGHVVRTGSYNVLGDAADQPARDRRTTPSKNSLLAAPGLRRNSSNVPDADVLGFALDGSSSLYGNRPEKIEGFPLLEEDFLLQLTRKYPNGTVWLFREDGSLSTSTDECAGSVSTPPSKRHDYDHRKAEAATLKNALPQVRQILFVPLFEAELSRATAGCFAFTTNTSRILSAEAELGFVKSFVNSVGAQVARINAIAADKSKNAFIGSISHELRSPLHGILAAAEFLEDTNVDTYQKSLISTQVSCGKTLLQVIEHVLDYSKINSFEKDEQAASQKGGPVSSDRLHFGSKLQNLYVNTDIAELCEEVVEGSVAGKSHMQSDIGVIGATAEAHSRRDQGEGLSEQKGREDHSYGFTKNVAVILDFDYQKDWTYVTQPGALRRILMNILGNSLKYTASGCIRIRLGVQNFDDPIGELSSIMFLSVSDTGRGISHDFLRKKLFSPFSQEDHLSTGCGLGLSIVKSLVNTLKGSMEVQSEPGIGTTVSLEIPLSRSDQNHSAEPPEPLMKPAEAENLSLPKEGLTVGFIGFKSDGRVRSPAFEGRDGSIKESIMKSVANCMVDWLQMEPSQEADSQIHEADYVVILVDDRITEFIQPYVEDVRKQQPRVIALLASEMSRRDVENLLGQSIHAFEVMSAPFGPRKMARAVAACEKAAANWQGHYRRPPPLTTLEKLKAIQTDLDVGSYLLERNGLVIRPKIIVQPARQSTNALRIPDPPREEREELSDLHESTKPKSPHQSDPTSPQSPPQKHPPRNSRLLLVDDNAINLRLLETFMRKRKCDYTCAENGRLAVEVFERALQEQDLAQPSRSGSPPAWSGYNIIFMDISMPVMDGLEATREIRKLEQKYRDQHQHQQQQQHHQSRANGENKTAAPPLKPALVVALTGLANSQDQTNAFASGVDLFMTKPVKFREIGRLLDEWDRNRDREGGHGGGASGMNMDRVHV